MTEAKAKDSPPSVEAAEDLVAQVDTGARQPKGPVGQILVYTAMAWSLFQIWYSSPLPFILGFGVIGDTLARSIHLAFAIFLAFMAFPAFKRSPRDRIPLLDWVLALAAAASSAYLVVFYAELSARPGAPIMMDLVVGAVGLVVLLEATRRALGPPLAVVALVFILYGFFGNYAPDVIAHGGKSFTKMMSHLWLGTEGVFGVALGVSTSMVFLFVLFGSILDKAGAGNYFIRVAFSLMGHMKGGPAKAAVVSSAMTGLISGSSIANVVTTGIFTIPLMKKVGFPAEKAGAVEVASSTNGQLTPPVMGAAAFLMVEYVGISYLEVIKHAFLPAIISYIALVYIVHLEAMKADMKGLPRKVPIPFKTAAISTIMSFLGMVILAGSVYYGVGWTRDVFGDAATWIVGGFVLALYVGLVRFATKFPPLERITDITVLPEPGITIKAGLQFLLPIGVLVWCLVVERLSPALSAFWGATFMIFIIVTLPTLDALFRGGSVIEGRIKEGLMGLHDGLIAGARNMIGIGVATATAGIVVGVVTLTGLSQKMTAFVEFVSAGNIFVLLILVAVLSLVLGMGLPTTANYIVVSTLMAPVIVTLGGENDLVIPLIAAHMFVFYFGILADDTPPVGLAAFAASAIAKSDPIKTGIQGFAYDIRTAILPFLFIFNTELLLIGVTSWYGAVLTFVGALIAMMAFASATQSYWITRNKLWESALMLLVAFTMFRPGYWMDFLYPPYDRLPGSTFSERVVATPENGLIKFVITGEKQVVGGFEVVDRIVTLHLGPVADKASSRLKNLGMGVSTSPNGDPMIAYATRGKTAQRSGAMAGWTITAVLVESERPSKKWMYIPALLLLAGLYVIQRRRRDAAA